MENIRRYFQQDALARHLGMELVDVSPGKAVTRMQVRDYHLNSWQTVHGGAIFALADFAFAAAANSHGTLAVALAASIAFLRPGGRGTLTAEATEIAKSSKIANYRIDVTDDAGQTVAVFQGTVYRKGDPIGGSGAT